MKYCIRLASESDLDDLCGIRNNKDLFICYFQQYEKNEVYLVIAELNKIILGFGVLKLKGKLFPKLSDLYVNETYRGNGVGSNLIKYREKIARDLGYTDLFVSVDPIENSKMIKLITKLGYKEVSEPYLKSAVFYNEDGTTYDKTYTRIDLKKVLN
ncbi:GNAT family N-acetyltransferase [Psychrobacillus sp. NPDC096623]|uniref:GNAT family N-acetyltransferase n=1 Tax=Psychrobacillus sp. NPDC096623 TaxID=3364492 RepID=UPI003806522A